VTLAIEVLTFAVAFVLGYVFGHREGVERTRARSAGQSKRPPGEPEGR